VTRKSKRELERTLERIDDGVGEPRLLVVYEDTETGEWYETAEMDDPVEPETTGEDVVVVVSDTVVETDWEPTE